MDTPAAMTYGFVISQESLRIDFLLATLNDLDVLSDNLQNKYLNAPPRTKAWFKSGPEFYQYEGRVFVIVRALYGMASSATIWRNELSKNMRDLGISSCLADTDIWMCASRKPYGYRYWEYILVHSDDLLLIYHRANLVMKGRDKAYTLNPDANCKKWAEPTMHLEADIPKFQVSDTGEMYLSISGDTHIKEAINNVDPDLDKYGRQLFKTARSPVNPGYQPETDVSPVLEDDQ